MTETPTTPTTRMQELIGHDSPESAYVVEDYPYGFRLRTTIRYWIETNRNGQRTMSQTRDPKRAGAPWNKPKGSTYSPVRVLLRNTGNGHVEHDALSTYADEEKIAAFVERYPRTSAEDRNRKVIDALIAYQRASKRVTWTVRSGTPDEIGTPQEQALILRKIAVEELKKIRADRGEPDGKE